MTLQNHFWNVGVRSCKSLFWVLYYTPLSWLLSMFLPTHRVGQDTQQDPIRFNNLIRDAEKQLRSSGMGDSLFHGQGPGDEKQKVWIDKYLNLVDVGLKEIFRQQQAPLILAGVDYLLSIYRRVSEYANIMQEGITGSPEHLRPEELQEKAWPIVEAYFLLEMEKIVEKYQQLAGTDKATYDIEQIVAAAFYGRVDKLLLSVNAQMWGIFNPDTGKVTLDSQGKSNQDNLELLDLVATKTLQNGGTVYALDQEEMPTDSPIAAVFSY
jgi:hypothetical protein